jgi:EAL domain-containing protein (putative c-di-GMP-specific phosphodiesterase class I)
VPKNGPVKLPKEFLSVAQDAPLMTFIGQLGLHESLQFVTKVREVVPDFRVGVNLAAAEVLQPEVLDNTLRLSTATTCHPTRSNTK